MRAEDLKRLIAAGNPIISLETPDEPRATRVVRAVAQEMALPLAEWSINSGLIQVFRRRRGRWSSRASPPPR